MIETWEGGDPAGVPLVFHHGTPSARLQATLGDEAAKRHGVRLISFSRPGYGRSTNTPPSLASVGQDTLRVADELGVDQFVVLGASGGGPYAIATGLADPQRVRAVGLAGGVGPWRSIQPPDSSNTHRRTTSGGSTKRLGVFGRRMPARRLRRTTAMRATTWPGEVRGTSIPRTSPGPFGCGTATWIGWSGCHTATGSPSVSLRPH